MTIDPFSASGFVGIAFGLMVGIPLGFWGAWTHRPALRDEPPFCPSCGFQGRGT